MKKPTTVEGWLKTLPEPLRSELLKPEKLFTFNYECKYLSSAINSFWWGYEEGSNEFWSSFWEALIWAESEEG